MFDIGYMDLESWAYSRSSEMRRVAANEARLRALPKRQRPTWMHRAAAQLGENLVALGLGLQRYGGARVQTTR